MIPTSAESLAELFQQGGSWMYPLAMLLLLGAVLGLICLASGFLVDANERPNAVVGGVALVVGMVALGLGFYGYGAARTSLDAALTVVNAADRETITAMGLAEASVLRLFGLLAAAVPIAGGLFSIAAYNGRRAVGGVLAAAWLALIGTGLVRLEGQRQDQLAHARGLREAKYGEPAPR